LSWVNAGWGKGASTVRIPSFERLDLKNKKYKNEKL
jgi:hypothetical protein